MTTPGATPSDFPDGSPGSTMTVEQIAAEVAGSRAPRARELGGCGEPLFLTVPGTDVCVLTAGHTALGHADHLDMGDLEFEDDQVLASLPLCRTAVAQYAADQGMTFTA